MSDLNVARFQQFLVGVNFASAVFCLTKSNYYGVLFCLGAMILTQIYSTILFKSVNK